MFTEKKKELADIVIFHAKKKNWEKYDAIAIGLLCDNDEKAEQMIRFIQENPDIEYYDLFLKALEIHGIKLENIENHG